MDRQSALVELRTTPPESWVESDESWARLRALRSALQSRVRLRVQRQFVTPASCAKNVAAMLGAQAPPAPGLVQELEIELDAAVFVAIDTEGVTRRASRAYGVREIGAVVCGDASQTFYEVVTPAGQVGGLAPADAARTWRGAVGPRFWEWLQRVGGEAPAIVLVGHAALQHDAPLLVAESTDLVPPALQSRLLVGDTLIAARRSLNLGTGARPGSLDAVYRQLFGGDPPKPRHNALADAHACAAVALRLRKQVGGTVRRWAALPAVGRLPAEE